MSLAFSLGLLSRHTILGRWNRSKALYYQIGWNPPPKVMYNILFAVSQRGCGNLSASKSCGLWIQIPFANRHEGIPFENDKKP